MPAGVTWAVFPPDLLRSWGDDGERLLPLGRGSSLQISLIDGMGMPGFLASPFFSCSFLLAFNLALLNQNYHKAPCPQL